MEKRTVKIGIDDRIYKISEILFNELEELSIEGNDDLLNDRLSLIENTYKSFESIRTFNYK